MHLSCRTFRRILAFCWTSALKKNRTICTVRYGGSSVILLPPAVDASSSFPNGRHALGQQLRTRQLDEETAGPMRMCRSAPRPGAPAKSAERPSASEFFSLSSLSPSRSPSLKSFTSIEILHFRLRAVVSSCNSRSGISIPRLTGLSGSCVVVVVVVEEEGGGGRGGGPRSHQSKRYSTSKLQSLRCPA